MFCHALDTSFTWDKLSTLLTRSKVQRTKYIERKYGIGLEWKLEKTMHLLKSLCLCYQKSVSLDN